jgi:glycosyltransferase involved in cell wall biosynthesis
LVLCDRQPTFKSLPSDRWEFARWSIESEVSLGQRMDVGLMPLKDSELSRGKCGFKMLAYMALGLPVVVSPVGVNQEILARGQIGFPARSTNDWFEALQRLYRDAELSNRMGQTGRRIVEQHYSVRTNVAKLAEIFHQVADC